MSAATETTVNLWVCSQSHPGRCWAVQLSRHHLWLVENHPDLLQNHIAAHRGLTQLEAVTHKKPLDKPRTEFKPLLPLSSVMVRFQLKHYHFLSKLPWPATGNTKIFLSFCQPNTGIQILKNSFQTPMCHLLLMPCILHLCIIFLLPAFCIRWKTTTTKTTVPVIQKLFVTRGRSKRAQSTCGKERPLFNLIIFTSFKSK